MGWLPWCGGSVTRQVAAPPPRPGKAASPAVRERHGALHHAGAFRLQHGLGLAQQHHAGGTLRIVGVLWVLAAPRPGRRRGQQQRAGHGPQRGSQAGQGARAHQLRSSPSWRASYTASVLELTLSLP